MIERLEEYLVACGLLTAQRAEDALRSQALVGGAMDTVLLEMGAVPEAELVNALGQVSGLQPIQLHVAVPHPVPMRGLEALVRKLGRSVAPWVAADVRVRQWRSRIYGTPLPAREGALLATLGPEPGRAPEDADASVLLRLAAAAGL